MGYDARMRALIGYRLTEDQLVTKRTVPNCEHSPGPQEKFCSQCGTKVGTRTEEMQSVEVGEYKGFELVSYGSSENGCYAAGQVSPWKDVSEQEVCIDWAALPKDLNDYAKTLQAQLATLGVTVELENFGVFAVSYESW